MAILETDFRPASQSDHRDVKHQFGPRVAHFCLHNPTFLLARAADTSGSSVTSLDQLPRVLLSP